MKKHFMYVLKFLFMMVDKLSLYVKGIKIMLYDKLVKACEEADVNLWDEIHHDEWEMLFHSDGRVVRKVDNSPEEVAERMAAINFENPAVFMRMKIFWLCTNLLLSHLAIKRLL